MENAPLRYAPKPVVVVTGWVALLAAVGWVLTTADPAGRALAVAATLLLGALTVTATVVRPRLAADRDGLQVGRLRGRRRWAWQDVERVEVMRTRRLGRESRVLEVDVRDRDGTEHLLVFTQLDLGADPVDAAQALRALSGRCGS